MEPMHNGVGSAQRKFIAIWSTGLVVHDFFMFLTSLFDEPVSSNLQLKTKHRRQYISLFRFRLHLLNSGGKSIFLEQDYKLFSFEGIGKYEWPWFLDIFKFHLRFFSSYNGPGDHLKCFRSGASPC